MDYEEAIIKKLCMDCSRRKDVCHINLPTYQDAYKCQWDNAQDVLKDMGKSFQKST